MPAELCDFCAEKLGDYWLYPTKSFPHSAFLEINGHWLACPYCHNLIQENNKQRLALHSFEQIREHLQFPIELKVALLKEIEELHRLFFANRVSLPRRMTIIKKEASNV